jgi:hypothetical protein
MEKDNRRYLGIDIGSTTFKAVVMDEDGNVLHTTYQRTKPVDSGPVACSGRCTSCGRCNMGGHFICLDGPIFSLAEIAQMHSDV